MNKRIKVKEDVIKLLIELSKDHYPDQYICKLLKSGEIINEISIFSNIKNNIPTIKSTTWTLVSAFSYGPYLEKFATNPDITFESDFIGFALSHNDDSLIPTEHDKKLFSYRGNVHIVTAYPFNNQSWVAFNNNGSKINIEIIK